jgi:hypothetical protein
MLEKIGLKLKEKLTHSNQVAVTDKELGSLNPVPDSIKKLLFSSDWTDIAITTIKRFMEDDRLYTDVLANTYKSDPHKIEELFNRGSALIEEGLKDREKAEKLDEDLNDSLLSDTKEELKAKVSFIKTLQKSGREKIEQGDQLLCEADALINKNKVNEVKYKNFSEQVSLTIEEGQKLVQEAKTLREQAKNIQDVDKKSEMMNKAQTFFSLGEQLIARGNEKMKDFVSTEKMVSDYTILTRSLHYSLSTSNRNEEGTHATAAIQYYLGNNENQSTITAKLIEIYTYINSIAATREKVLRPIDGPTPLDLSLQVYKAAIQEGKKMELPGVKPGPEQVLTHSGTYVTSLELTERIFDDFHALLNKEMSRVKSPNSFYSNIYDNAKKEILVPFGECIQKMKQERQIIQDQLDSLNQNNNNFRK